MLPRYFLAVKYSTSMRKPPLEFLVQSLLSVSLSEQVSLTSAVKVISPLVTLIFLFLYFFSQALWDLLSASKKETMGVALISLSLSVSPLANYPAHLQPLYLVHSSWLGAFLS